MPNVTVTLTGDEARLLASLDKVVQKERQLGQAAGDAGMKSRQAGEVSARTMQRVNDAQEKQIAGYGRMAASIGAVAMAANIARQAVESMNRANDEAAAKQRGAERGLSSLSQLAGGSPRQLRKFTEAAKEVYRGGGAANMDEAARLVFALESAGAGGERNLFASLYGIVDSPASLAKSAAALRGTMGAKETGSLQDLVSKSMAAARFGEGGAEGLLGAAAGAGDYAAALGISDEDLLATIALMSRRQGGAEGGGAAVSGLLRALQKKGGYQGLGMAGAIQKLQERNLSDKGLMRYLGRGGPGTVNAFRNISELLPQIEAASQAIGQAQQSDLVGNIVASAQLNPDISAAREARMAAAGLELSRQDRGRQRNLSEAIIQRSLAEKEKAGDSQFGTALTEWNLYGQRWLFGDEYTAYQYGTTEEHRRMLGGLVDRSRRAGEEALEAKVNKPAGLKIDVQFDRDPNAGTE